MHKIICIGLGNPGPQFNLTRHNIGFLIVDALAEQLSVAFSKEHNYLIATSRFRELEFSLIKPQTFMNNSGAVLPFLIKKGIDKKQIIVLHDELELAFGILKWKYAGSAKGHNGLRSIIEYIGPDFERLRFGIGRPINKAEVGDYVLQPFSVLQQEQLSALIAQAVDYVIVHLHKISDNTFI